MKATFATIACLILAGILSAAEVGGNNTAVVIQKDAVKSATNYQFLCVPVDGLAINGTAESPIAIGTILPTTAYTTGAKVYVLSEDGVCPSNPTFTLGDTGWTLDESQKGTNVNDDGTLSPGRILWVNGETSADSVLFCGQNRTRADQTRKLGTVAMRNDGASEITFEQVLKATAADGAVSYSSPKMGDQVLLVTAGSTNYKRYRYDSSISKWRDYKGAEINLDDIKIKPGEAFYYYSATAAD
ncbi:MAG: hypothetical protein ACI4RT_00720 [Candidatus Spyradenecus sp.]